MAKWRNNYMRSLIRRVFIVLVVILFAFVVHRVSLSYNQQVFGAIIFIILFTSSLLYYYITLFKAKEMHPTEFLLSLFLVFILTILMFALIYNEPINDSHSYFIENNVVTYDLSLSSSFYFSTITITTLGYGDIAPVGSYRFFAMTEVILGLVYGGTIVYFLTRAFE